MENASKALIIAGAILLSILIIALGMKIYNSATSSVGSADLSAQEINSHNSQFTSFNGKQSGEQVRRLISLIKSNNLNYVDRMVKIEFNPDAVKKKVKESDVPKYQVSDDKDDNDYKITDDIKNATSYYVTFSYNDAGFVGGVNIHKYSEYDLSETITVK